MDDEDFLFLITQVEEQLREAGAPELAREASYVVDDPETGARRLLPPQHRLVAMLAAFERHMAVRDWATYRDAMLRVAASVEGRPPERAVVVPLDGDAERLRIDLSESPDLSEPRGRLRALIARLAGTDFGPDFILR